MTILLILIVALIAESIWETLKMTWDSGKVSIDRIGALAVAIGICFAAQVDLLSIVGVVIPVPYVGYLLTGILMSRGSNFVHDLFNTIQGLAQNLKPK